MIKLIASDIDGTLLQNGTREISEEFFTYIKELQKRGIYFAAASGRQLANLERLFAPIKDEMAYIGENGALIVYQGKVISKQPIERTIGEKILQDIREQEDCEILLSGMNTSYLEPKTKDYEDHMRFLSKIM